jgi:hypothetical protein
MRTCFLFLFKTKEFKIIDKNFNVQGFLFLDKHVSIKISTDSLDNEKDKNVQIGY